MYISYGKTTEPYFPQKTIDKILSTISGDLKSRDYGKAVVKAAKLMKDVLEGKDITAWTKFDYFLVFVFVGLFLLFFGDALLGGRILHGTKRKME